MKRFVVCVMILVCVVANAQSIGFRVGHSLTPADHLSLRYEHWTNGAINFTLTGFFERSRKHSLTYSCYGADLLAEYSPFRDAEAMPVFSWRAGLGSTWQVESEPWLYKSLSFAQRMNYGLVTDAAAECNLTENFILSLFAQQKFLLRKQMGSTRFCFGLGLTYKIPSW